MDDGGAVVVGKHLKLFIANQYQQLFMSAAGDHMEDILECV